MEDKIFLSWKDIEALVDNLAEQINKMDKKPFYIYGVPRGGAIPAVWLSHKTGIDYYQLNSAQISKMADLSHILIVDDICDSGETIKKIKENFPKCQTATLYYKETAIDKPDIYGEIVGDEWLVFPWEEEEEIGNRDNTYGL
jgi:hypoxanthine phosphoribosyltransferase